MSAVAHLGLLAWPRSDEAATALPRASFAIEIEVVPPPPAAVMSAPSLPASRPIAPPTMSPRVAGSLPVKPTTLTATTTRPTTSPRSPRSPTSSRTLSMRTAGDVDLRLRDETIGGPATRSTLAGGIDLDADLEHQIGGRPGAAKSPVERDDNFTVEVDDNGTAHVKRKPDTTAHITAPTFDDIRHGFADWWEIEKFSDKDYLTLAGDKIAEKHGVHIIHFDGELDFLIPVFGGNFDLSHLVMTGHGDDPYAAHRQAVLDRTRDERAAALDDKRKAALAGSRRTMDANLARMWAATSDPATRKQALFEMWDECAETGDDATVAAGNEARDAVLRFIHSHQVAFTPAEVADFNRGRHSHGTFDPVGDPR